MKRIALAIAVILVYALAIGAISAKAKDLVPIITTGPNESRLNIVLLADGYVESERPKAIKDAISKATGLLGLAPWNTNAGHLNFWLVFTNSQESGITKKVLGFVVEKNTAFGSHIGWNNQANFLFARDVFVVESRYRPLFSGCRVIFTIMANDSSSGGGAFGRVATITRGASSGVWSHELGGHCMAGLGDEYTSSISGLIPSAAPNVALSTNDIPWKHLILNGTPIPTPTSGIYSNAVGAFKGAAYSTKAFRPQRTCLMMDTTKPPCTVCLEAMTRAIVGP
jgi:hypothetical protein